MASMENGRFGISRSDFPVAAFCRAGAAQRLVIGKIAGRRCESLGAFSHLFHLPYNAQARGLNRKFRVRDRSA